MKIGAFAEKFNISKETIRFYVSKKLLTPVKNGSFFIYNEKCERDMQLIIELKSLGFSLDEIAKYLSFRRLSTKNMIAMHQDMIALFSGKIAEVQDKIEMLKAAEKELTIKFEEIRDFEMGEQSTLGVPFEVVQSLFCPDCGLKLQILNGEISKNYIISGKMECDCGYKAEIRDGIIIFEGANFQNLFEQNPELLNHEQMIPTDYLNASMSNVHWMTDQFLKEDLEHKTIFDYGTQSGVAINFVLEKILNRTKNITFYALDNNFHMISECKAIFSLNKRHSTAVFMCGNLEKAPLKKSSCDYLLSCYGLQTNVIASKKDVFKEAKSFLKSDGKWFETFFSAQKRSAVQSDYSDRADYFVDERLKDILSNMREYYFHNSATTMEKGELGYYIKDDAEVSFFSYIGIK